MKEKILYGTLKNNPDWKEEILSTKPEQFEKVKKIASKDGYRNFRVATINLNEKPNFKNTIE